MSAGEEDHHPHHMQRRVHRYATPPRRHDHPGEAKPRAAHTASLLLLAATTGQEKYGGEQAIGLLERGVGRCCPALLSPKKLRHGEEPPYASDLVIPI
jgi:hypothetical protein